MKKIAVIGLIAFALIATGVLAQQTEHQGSGSHMQGMMGQRMMQGMMGERKAGEEPSESLKGMQTMMSMMMKMMDQCSAMMGKSKEDNQSK
jgi:hypothetical protein